MGYPKIKHTTVEINPKIIDLTKTAEYLAAYTTFSRVNTPLGEEKANSKTIVMGTITKKAIHNK